MVLRVAGSEKIPTWQIPASIVVGFISVGIFLWAASKVFRIGVLMYGKPPNIPTLIKWIRMA
jgi:ABC-2 type transport system permease protein